MKTGRYRKIQSISAIKGVAKENLARSCLYPFMQLIGVTLPMSKKKLWKLATTAGCVRWFFLYISRKNLSFPKRLPMDAPQSEMFKRMPRDVKRAALRAAIAGQRPGSGTPATFEFEGKRYRVVPVTAEEVTVRSSVNSDTAYQ